MELIMDRDFIHVAARDLIHSLEESVYERDNRGREKEILALPEVHIIESYLVEIYKKGLEDGRMKD
jgi:hypothetical protein